MRSLTFAVAILMCVYGGFNPGEGPRYVICRVRATIEVLDHSVMGPIVRVVDDPSIVSGALDFVKMEKCF
jgi:hypothetical protein